MPPAEQFKCRLIEYKRVQDVANIANTISGAYAGNQLASNTTQKKISFFQLRGRPFRWVRSCLVCVRVFVCRVGMFAPIEVGKIEATPNLN